MQEELQADVVKYISTVQPELEKMAGERTSFLSSLNSKLTAMVKAGSLREDEARTIYKQAMENPANVLNYLDVPTYQHRVGSIAKEASFSKERDPLEEFCFGT